MLFIIIRLPSTSFCSLFQDSQLEIQFLFSTVHIFFLYCTVIKKSKLYHYLQESDIVTEVDKGCIVIHFLNRSYSTEIIYRHPPH